MVSNITILLMAFFLFSCASSDDSIVHKIDAPLMQKIGQLEKEGAGGTIDFLGKCNSSISEAMKKELENTGIKLYTSVNDIFTASGNAGQIKETAALDFVIRLELSVKREIK